MQPGKVVNDAMVSTPGSGLLSTGFQQVAGRPFFLSEWMSLIPNEWTAESAPIVAAYGLGLQGWDASFSFAMDYSHFTKTVQSGHGVYNVTSPTHLALYPALAAMLYRGDITEAPIVANRFVDTADLRGGRLPFFERVEQESDVKKLQSAVPLDALASGRVVLSFAKQDAKAPAVVRQRRASADSIVQAVTKQLTWRTEGGGYFTINSGGTQGAVGFLPGKSLSFADMELKPEPGFAVVLVSSPEKDKPLANANRWLITTVARARNTGMAYSADKTALTAVGEAPILLEPVAAALLLKKKAKYTLHVLDHSGNRTGVTVPVESSSVMLDGSKYKTIYYELVRE
jgi:hypothetical protein